MLRDQHRSAQPLRRRAARNPPAPTSPPARAGTTPTGTPPAGTTPARPVGKPSPPPAPTVTPSPRPAETSIAGSLLHASSLHMLGRSLDRSWSFLVSWTGSLVVSLPFTGFGQGLASIESVNPHVDCGSDMTGHKNYYFRSGCCSAGRQRHRGRDVHIHPLPPRRSCWCDLPDLQLLVCHGLYACVAVHDCLHARVPLTLRLICGYFLRSLLPFLTFLLWNITGR